MTLRTRQSGTSLISMLVGAFLATIGLVSMASVFKTVVYRSVDSRVSAKQDTQVALALVTLPIALSKAGYGIGAASNSCAGATTAGPAGSANTDLVVIRDPVLASENTQTVTLGGTQQTIGALGSAATVGKAVVWHWNDGGADRCAGLVSTAGGLRRLAPRNCSDATQWNAGTWTAQDLIAPSTLSESSAVSFTASRVASCAPYGMGTSSPGVLISASAGNSTASLSTRESICLPNICK